MNIRWLPIASFVCCQLAFAQQGRVQPSQEPLPQVDVEAQRAKLHVMRAELTKLEDQFFSEYNKLNVDPQYAVHCDDEAVTGTRLENHKCRPVFQERAEHDEALWVLGIIIAPPAHQTVELKTKDYQKNVVDVISKHPELLKVLQEREAVEKRLEAIRAEKHQEKFFVFD